MKVVELAYLLAHGFGLPERQMSDNKIWEVLELVSAVSGAATELKLLMNRQ